MIELETLETKIKNLRDVISISHDEIRLIRNKINEPILEAYRANLVGQCFKYDDDSYWYKILGVESVHGTQLMCQTVAVDENSINVCNTYHAISSEPIPNEEFDTALNNLLQKINQFKTK